MARAPVGARRRAGESRRDAAAGGGDGVRKGPWMPYEDAVLLEHVRTHGPFDWSSIRSKGLLPRTGKSCRLRWVNKLRPNLKSGCKFSSEEERVVLDLQAQFGNKWARIATYLPGRTDNDVKNFWSTRQKKIARLQRGFPPRRSGKKRSTKAPAASSLEPRLALGPFLDQVTFEGSSSSGQYHAATPSFMDAQNAALIPYDQEGSQLLRHEGAFLPAVPATDSQACSSNARPMTDSEVKDFFPCTRQKRSAGRLLCTPLPGWSSTSRNHSIKTDAAASLQSQPAVGPFLELAPFEGGSSSGQDRAGTLFIDSQNSALVPYDQTGSQLFGFNLAQPPVTLTADSQACSSNAATLLPPKLPFCQPPYPLLDCLGMPGSSDTTPWFLNASAMDDLANQELLPLLQSAPVTFPFFGMHDGVKIEPQYAPNQFDDLPPDLFDSDDKLPPGSSPSRTISDL